jgi:hypothetical protein
MSPSELGTYPDPTLTCPKGKYRCTRSIIPLITW